MTNAGVAYQEAEEKQITKTFLNCRLLQIKENGQVKEDKKGRAYSTHGDKSNVQRILQDRTERRRPSDMQTHVEGKN